VEVEHKVRSTKEGIANLPAKPSGDPVSTIWKMKAAFEKDVKQLVEGRPEDGTAGLIQIFRHSREQFRDTIFRQAPEFKPFPRPSFKFGGSQLGSAQSQQAPNPGHVSTEDAQIAQEEDLEPSGVKNPSTFVYMDEVLEVARA
jgi:hypothetical protein